MVAWLEMSEAYIPPAFEKSAFHCPYCAVFSQQLWFHAYQNYGANHPLSHWVDKVYLAKCTHCEEASIWLRQSMVWPPELLAPMTHADMPVDIAKDFEEARSVFSSSPRSAAALLRLCVQKLCMELGEPGKSINDDIGSLVSKGLSAKIQQALDVVRVVGNEQVHPGTLDVRDNPEIASKLFSLVNFIVDDQISKPKQIAELYQQLPAAKLEGIENRDKPKASVDTDISNQEAPILKHRR